jgi:predicted Zn-dependent protease
VVPDGEPAPDESAGAADPEQQKWVLGELALAQSELEAGKGAQALKRLTELDATSPIIAAHRAAAALAAGEPAIAERDARAVLSAAPGRTDMRILLARALSAQGREAEAGRALAALPLDFAPMGWVVLDAARAEIAVGRSDLALRRLSLARERHPDDPELATATAALLDASGRSEEALAAREEALAAAPGNPRLENAVAWTLAGLGRDLDRALTLAQSAVAANDAEPAFLDTLATVLLVRGEHAEVLAVVERALPSASGETRDHLLQLQAQARTR